MLKPGTYRLTHDVTNPKPDRRVKEDWRDHVTWPAGTEFLVEPVMHKERDDEPVSLWTKIIKVGHRWQFENIDPNLTEQYAALERALEPCEMSNAAFFTKHDIKGEFPRWLIESGRLTRELFLKLWGEHVEDGDLHTGDPFPQRPTLIDPSARPVGRYRLEIADDRVRGGNVTREMTCTEIEAWTDAAREIKLGSPFVRVWAQAPDGSFASVGELKTNGAPSSDVAIRDLFKQIHQGIDDAQSAVHALAVELGAAVLVESAIAEHEQAMIDRVIEVMHKHGIYAGVLGQDLALAVASDVVREIADVLGGES